MTRISPVDKLLAADEISDRLRRLLVHRARAVRAVDPELHAPSTPDQVARLFRDHQSVMISVLEDLEVIRLGLNPARDHIEMAELMRELVADQYGDDVLTPTEQATEQA